MNWFNRIFRRGLIDEELAEELRGHIEEKTEYLMRSENLSRAEARRIALRAFGNRTLVETHSREVWRWSKLESFLIDLKLALRRLRKSPGFAATVLLTLAIGIGANAAVFSVLNSVVLRPLPSPQPDQLVATWLHAPGAAGLANFTEGLRLSPSMYLTFAKHNRTLQSIGVWVSGTANITGLDKPEEVHTTYISDGVLQTLNVPPAAGRWISTADQAPGSREVVVLSYGY
ncbi:MAG TPA: permease prefix domain 1-containing protein [Blastocatellia bacterium]